MRNPIGYSTKGHKGFVKLSAYFVHLCETLLAISLRTTKKPKGPRRLCEPVCYFTKSHEEAQRATEDFVKLSAHFVHLCENLLAIPQRTTKALCNLSGYFTKNHGEAQRATKDFVKPLSSYYTKENHKGPRRTL